MCDCFVALAQATKNNEIIFAKNTDREFYEAQYLQNIPAQQYAAGEKLKATYIEIDQVSSTNSIFISKPHWIWGAEMGANEHGLVIGNEAIFTKVEPSTVDGLIGMDLLRLALERASNRHQAVEVIADLLAKHGQGGNCGYKEECRYHNSFLIADTEGSLILETLDQDWIVRPADDFDAISNAYTIKKNFSKISDTLLENTVERGFLKEAECFNFKDIYEDVIDSKFGNQRRTYSLAKLAPMQRHFRIKDAFQQLREHGDENAVYDDLTEYGIPRLCMHMKGSFLDATTGSWVSSITPERQIHWVTATPAACTSLFKPTFMGLEIPVHGGLPGEESDTSTLWWQHERLRLFLLDAASNDELEEFNRERSVLEDKFIALVDSCPIPMNDQTKKTCQNVVNSCWQEAQMFEDKWFKRAEATKQ